MHICEAAVGVAAHFEAFEQQDAHEFFVFLMDKCIEMPPK